MVKDPGNRQGVEELFEQIMSMSRKLQYKMLAEGKNQLRLPFDMVESLPTETCMWSFREMKAPIPRRRASVSSEKRRCLSCGKLPGCHECTGRGQS